MSYSLTPNQESIFILLLLKIYIFVLFQVKEDIDAIQRLKILIDYDDNGYLLQVKGAVMLYLYLHLYLYLIDYDDNGYLLQVQSETTYSPIQKGNDQ